MISISLVAYEIIKSVYENHEFMKIKKHYKYN